jgi:hypothetical protein
VVRLGKQRELGKQGKQRELAELGKQGKQGKQRELAELAERMMQCFMHISLPITHYPLPIQLSTGFVLKKTP